MCEKLIERWNAETPIFFKKLRNLSIAIGGSATSVWLANSTMGLNLNETLLSICKYAIASCCALGLSSQLTKIDTPKQD